ncbi:hypothetical protein [Planomonospora parontospora]|uniref:hypothetical protein n=1 Tax=Planomonospora parontospora TaxID=58119 RepID=UPI00166FD26F|nr:hypothetical protein [Planomonospora parontospora]GGL28130.1 hypothetical protein GCM10014719_32010 [Planomonospora parontospora subsp. antibiotica]GII20106.1 hypothetical protein Ppa05_68320 [Planomonospora parontospora subsp. antibiotica]
MKRVIAGIAAATVTTSVAATPAQASSADPVKVLKSQFAAGKGVKFTDVTTTTEFAGSTSFLKRTGSFQFGRTGIVASDVTTKITTDELSWVSPSVLWRLGESERTIRIGTDSYYSGSTWKPSKGKTWIKHQDGMTAGLSGWSSQLVNPIEPATLKVLITKGKRTGRTYSGKISFGALAKVSPWLRNADLIKMSGEEKREVLRFTLTLGTNGLPQRLVTVYPQKTHGGKEAGHEDRRLSVETRYTGWGSRVSIKAPPASKTDLMKKPAWMK